MDPFKFCGGGGSSNSSSSSSSNFISSGKSVNLLNQVMDVID